MPISSKVLLVETIEALTKSFKRFLTNEEIAEPAAAAFDCMFNIQNEKKTACITTHAGFGTEFEFSIKRGARFVAPLLVVSSSFMGKPHEVIEVELKRFGDNSKKVEILSEKMLKLVEHDALYSYFLRIVNLKDPKSENAVCTGKLDINGNDCEAYAFALRSVVDPTLCNVELGIIHPRGRVTTKLELKGKFLKQSTVWKEYNKLIKDVELHQGLKNHLDFLKAYLDQNPITGVSYSQQSDGILCYLEGSEDVYQLSIEKTKYSLRRNPKKNSELKFEQGVVGKLAEIERLVGKETTNTLPDKLAKSSGLPTKKSEQTMGIEVELD